ncbi:nicotinate (nicotinamide) nucleotide adenylyltransferase [Shewanella sp. KT0246]|uniref:nicotinate (nicotinamide) nucleotide adenylyltransferase n=1 Tax=Shewanella sp. KT0246 TaxID=2815912 RepID=UPI001BC43881|nr:nicotinate (nicotinamide) nucleotide adenylyltransferase [Shewanella sp. KT0246]GIU47424.1 putative nicotinate-nucleotide adenylyltransferase [Shewanella sp. KT0246]
MKIGLLGGTFDPIHYGHIKPALEVQQRLELDKIWLMPNHIPPHKQTTQVSSQHRLTMVELISQQYDEFEVCDIEINRDMPSYSATTLQILSEQYPLHQFYFIMGTDSFIQFQSWYQWQSILKLCNIVVCQRPGWQLDKTSPMAEILEQNMAVSTLAKTGKIFPIDVSLQDISSTEIRHILYQGGQRNLSSTPAAETTNISETSHMLPNVIQEYIFEHHLYQNK